MTWTLRLIGFVIFSVLMYAASVALHLGIETFGLMFGVVWCVVLIAYGFRADPAPPGTLRQKIRYHFHF